MFSVAARSQVHWPAGRAPVTHISRQYFCLAYTSDLAPSSWCRGLFAASEIARKGEYAWRVPGGEDLRQEQRAPVTVFSVFAFSQLHLRADCLPQEHLAFWAQTQAWPERPQQVVGTVMVGPCGVCLLDFSYWRLEMVLEVILSFAMTLYFEEREKET